MEYGAPKRKKDQHCQGQAGRGVEKRRLDGEGRQLCAGEAKRQTYGLELLVVESDWLRVFFETEGRVLDGAWEWQRRRHWRGALVKGLRGIVRVSREEEDFSLQTFVLTNYEEVCCFAVDFPRADWLPYASAYPPPSTIEVLASIEKLRQADFSPADPTARKRAGQEA